MMYLAFKLCIKMLPFGMGIYILKILPATCDDLLIVATHLSIEFYLKILILTVVNLLPENAQKFQLHHQFL